MILGLPPPPWPGNWKVSPIGRSQASWDADRDGDVPDPPRPPRAAAPAPRLRRRPRPEPTSGSVMAVRVDPPSTRSTRAAGTGAVRFRRAGPGYSGRGYPRRPRWPPSAPPTRCAGPPAFPQLRLALVLAATAVNAVSGGLSEPALAAWSSTSRSAVGTCGYDYRRSTGRARWPTTPGRHHRHH